MSSKTHFSSHHFCPEASDGPPVPPPAVSMPCSGGSGLPSPTASHHRPPFPGSSRPLPPRAPTPCRLGEHSWFIYTSASLPCWQLLQGLLKASFSASLRAQLGSAPFAPPRPPWDSQHRISAHPIYLVTDGFCLSSGQKPHLPFPPVSPVSGKAPRT